MVPFDCRGRVPGRCWRPVRPGGKCAVFPRETDQSDRRLIVGRRLRHLCPPPCPSSLEIHSRQSHRCSQQHAGRGEQYRRRPSLRGGTEGRHRYRSAADRRPTRPAVRRCRPRQARRLAISLSRLGDHRLLRVHRPRRRAGEVVQGPSHSRTDHRREPARHVYARFSCTAQQHGGDQIAHRQRVSRNARDHAGDRKR